MKHVLMVDDDRVILNLLSEGLREHGYQVAAAISGKEALELVESQAFDLAVLDMRMPGMSGIDLARVFRERATIPFIFLSAFADETVVNEAVEAGAMGYLVKPVDMPQLIAFIEASAARAREMDELRKTAGHLDRALSIERKTRTAVGIIMASRGLNREQAFDVLRARARSQRRRIGELAEELICSLEATHRIMHDA